MVASGSVEFRVLDFRLFKEFLATLRDFSDVTMMKSGRVPVSELFSRPKENYDLWLRSWIALFFWWALLVMTLDWVMYMAGAMILSVDVSLTRAFIVYMCGLVSAWWLAHLTWYATLRRRGCACAFCCCCVDAPVLMLIHAVALAMWGVLLTVNAFVVLTYSGYFMVYTALQLTILIPVIFMVLGVLRVHRIVSSDLEFGLGTTPEAKRQSGASRGSKASAKLRGPLPVAEWQVTARASQGKAEEATALCMKAAAVAPPQQGVAGTPPQQGATPASPQQDAEVPDFGASIPVGRPGGGATVRGGEADTSAPKKSQPPGNTSDGSKSSKAVSSEAKRSRRAGAGGGKVSSAPGQRKAAAEAGSKAPAEAPAGAPGAAPAEALAATGAPAGAPSEALPGAAGAPAGAPAEAEALAEDLAIAAAEAQGGAEGNAAPGAGESQPQV